MDESIDDLTVSWTLHGPELARRMLALADELQTEQSFDRRLGYEHASAGDRIREVVRCDYNPLHARNSSPGRSAAPEPGS